METRASATWGDYKRWCSADYAVSNWTKISSRITVMSAAFADTRKALGLEADHALIPLVALHIMGLGQRGVKSRTVLYLLTLEEFRSYRIVARRGPQATRMQSRRETDHHRAEI